MQVAKAVACIAHLSKLTKRNTLTLVANTLFQWPSCSLTWVSQFLLHLLQHENFTDK